ncbi:MAG: CoB--CoM heterodisulfide reductase iron-sulfur subunit A family protein [candidate division Zixibacteria bacterium]|nr:CoB--CoM heterodisulfide reductase iron-sulfur subunit A family protein [candidate division Zixibacteria bacterium]
MVKVKKHPKYVTGQQPLDDSMAEQLTSERDNDFNYGMDKTKVLYQPHDMAYPRGYVLDRKAMSDADKETLINVCPEGAIDFEMPEEEFEINVGAIIVATGWRPYDANNLDNLGYGKFPDVITNVMMERMAAKTGPTEGEIIRPSDGKKAENVAFVQCAGSRDENHLPYCSAVCCMASLKQVRYLREINENANATVFYIDIRTVGREEKFYFDMLEDDKVSFVKGKVAQINEDNGELILDVEDTINREKLHNKFDLVVLATGMVPNTADLKIPIELKYDDYSFINRADNTAGIFAVGCAQGPCDVSRAAKESTAAALKAIQCLGGGD